MYVDISACVHEGRRSSVLLHLEEGSWTTFQIYLEETCRALDPAGGSHWKLTGRKRGVMVSLKKR